jgi:hypothetical protein
MGFDEEHVDYIQSYGIVWEDYDDDQILNHHNHSTRVMVMILIHFPPLIIDH